MSKTIAITGGTGFIGRNLANVLLESGYSVKLIDNNTDAKTLNEIDGKFTNIHYIRNIENYGQIHHVLKDADSVVHLAANPGVQFSIQNPHCCFNGNILGTFNCIEATRANGIKNFIFASSGSVLGNADIPYDENSIAQPMSPYGASKLVGESLCHSYSASYGMNCISLRFSNVYGPYGEHKDNLIPIGIKSAIKNSTMYIYGTGNQTRDFIYVDDLIQGIILGIEGKLDSGVYQLATGESYTVNDIVSMIQKKSMGNLKKELKVEYREARKGEPKEYVVNIDKIRSYGFRPQFNISNGLDKTMNWFKRFSSIICRKF